MRTDGQTLFPIETLSLLPVHRVPFMAQQHMETPVAEPALLGSQLTQSLPQCRVIWPSRSVTNHLAVRPNDLTRPPLAHLVGRGEMSDSFPLGGGRQNFFVRRSFNATLSSIASARSRFSLAFSSSSAFRRFASDTSMPPNFAFQA